MDASLSMLRTAMSDNAKAYEYLFDNSDKGQIKIDENSPHSSNSDHLIRVMQQMQQNHEMEKTKLQLELKQAKSKSKHYKQELRENLSERLQYLEDRALEQAQSSSSSRGTATTLMEDGSSLMLDDATHTNQRELELALERMRNDYAQEKTEWGKRLDLLEGKYSADLEAWQKEVTKLKDDSRRLLAERNQLKSRLTAATVSPSKIRTQFNQALQERDEAVMLLEEVQNDLKATKKEAKEAKKRYKTELKALDEPIDQVESIYRDSVDKRNALSDRMRIMETQHENDKAKWKLQLETAIANAQKSNSELQKTKKELATTTEMAAQTSEELLTVKESHAKEIDAIRILHAQEIDRVKKELKDAQNAHIEELESIREKTDQMAQQCTASEQEWETYGKHLKAKHQQELDEWNDFADKSQTKTLEMQEEMEALKKDHAAEKNALIQSHEQEVSELKEKHAEELQEAEDDQKRRYHAKLEISKQDKDRQLELEIEEDRRGLLELEQQIAQLHGENKNLVKELEDSRQEIIDSKNESLEQVKSLEKEVAELRRDMQDEKQESHLDLVNQVQEGQALIQKLANQLESLQDQLTEKSAQLEESSAQAFSLTADLEMSRNSVADITSQLDESMRQAKEAKDALKESLSSTRGDTEEVSEQDESSKKRLNNLSEELRDAQEELSETKEEVRRAEQKILKLSNDLREAQEEVSEANQDLRTYKQKVSDLREELREVRQEQSVASVPNESATESNTENVKKEILRWKETAFKLEKSVNDLMATESKSAEGYQKEIDALKATVCELSAEKDTLEVSLSECQSMVSKMKEQLAAETFDREKHDALKAFHVGAMEELERKHNKELQALQKDFDVTVATLEARELQNKDLVRQCSEADTIIKSHSQILSETKSNYSKEIAELNKRIEGYEALKERHTSELAALSNSLIETKAESEEASARATMLSNSLEEISSLHDNSNGHWKDEVGRLEKENKVLREGMKMAQDDALIARQQVVTGLEKYQKEVSSTVLELRQDIDSVKDAFSKSDVRANVQEIHTAIFDALAEITLETENLIDCRSGLEILVERTNTILNSEQQHNAEGSKSSPLVTRELDFAKEQLRLEKSSNESAHKQVGELSERLAQEKAMREKAEEEIRTLNDQADALGEEVMRLQAINTDLEDTIKVAEQRMEAAIDHHADHALLENGDTSRHCGNNESKPAENKSEDCSDEDTSPMLDEALALAKNLTALMQGNPDTEKETSVMEMLETMSEMIDMSDPPIPMEVYTPRKEKKMDFSEEDDDEDPPAPILSPPWDSRNTKPDAPSGELTLVVDQLYTRCQMLERERTDIMEVTLDLLESAREASSAELEAALATARRKSAEELLKVRNENQEGMWRLYHKLCGSCQKGLQGNRPEAKCICSSSTK